MKMRGLGLILSALFLASCQQEAQAPAPETQVEQGRTILLDFERTTLQQRAKARTLIAAELADIGLVPQDQPYDTRSFPDIADEHGARTEGSNLVATLPATTDSGRVILVGAHFDSVPGSPGVDDNGSGVHILLALARHLAALPVRDAAVVFAFFDQEETGHVGSKIMAARWKADGRPLEAMHNVDMIGWDSDDDGVIEFDSNDDALTRLYMDAAKGLPVSLLVTTYPDTDHHAFREAGFTVASISEEFEDGSENPNYHKPGDTAVQWPYLDAAQSLMTRVFEALLDPAYSSKATNGG